MATCLDQAKNAGLGPEAYARADHDFSSEKAAKIYPLYEKTLRKQNALDFGDLIVRTIELFRDDNARGGELARRFAHILVDEFQDTNGAQYELCKQMARGGGEVCVVGDDDQSIYSWRGAEVRNILGFPRDFQGARIVALGNNYRCAGAIVRAAAHVVSRNSQRHEKHIFTENDEGQQPVYVRLRDERDEARHVGAELERLALDRGFAYRELAVIYRTNAQSRVLEDALRERRLPHAVVGGVRFYERKEVRDVIGYLRLVVNRASDVDFRRVVNVPARGFGAASLQLVEARAKADGTTLFEAARAMTHDGSDLSKRAATSLREFVKLVTHLGDEAATRPVGNLCRYLLDHTGYRKALQGEKTAEARARLENIEELVSAAEEFEAQTDDATLATFLEGAALVSEADFGEGDNTISLMTVHAAKGLEFRGVFITGLEEGTFPHSRSKGPAELEEERRLLYVGMTRAKDVLWLSSVAVRRLFGESRGMVESRFAKELEGVVSVENRVYEEVVPDGVTFYPRRGRGSAKPEYEDAMDFVPFDEDAPSSARPRDARAPTRQAVAPRRAMPGEDAHTVYDEALAPMGPRKGMKVAHAMFGEGRIESVVGSGKDCKLVVRFGAAQKTIVAKYVTLLGY